MRTRARFRRPPASSAPDLTVSRPPPSNSSLTTRGEAYRNAPVRSLLEFAGPRDAVQVTRERALVVRGDGAGVGSGAPAGGAFATDVVPGRTVMDVEEFEGRLSSVRSAARAACGAPSRAKRPPSAPN